MSSLSCITSLKVLFYFIQFYFIYINFFNFQSTFRFIYTRVHTLLSLLGMYCDFILTVPLIIQFILYLNSSATIYHLPFTFSQHILNAFAEALLHFKNIVFYKFSCSFSPNPLLNLFRALANFFLLSVVLLVSQGCVCRVACSPPPLSHFYRQLQQLTRKPIPGI